MIWRCLWHSGKGKAAGCYHWYPRTVSSNSIIWCPEHQNQRQFHLTRLSLIHSNPYESASHVKNGRYCLCGRRYSHSGRWHCSTSPSPGSGDRTTISRPQRRIRRGVTPPPLPHSPPRRVLSSVMWWAIVEWKRGGVKFCRRREREVRWSAVFLLAREEV